MQHGRVDFSGGTVEAVQKYLAKSGATSHERVWESWDEAPGSDVLKIKSIRAVSLRTDGQDSSLFDLKTPLNVEIECRVFQKSQVHVTLHFLTEQEEVAFTSASIWDDKPDAGDYRLICHIPANLLNELCYSVRILVVANGNKVVHEESDTITIDVRDITPRSVGSYHGKEPGPIRPELKWSFFQKNV
jgi:lipopolysaccharide transport system ATP-binding protein